MKDVNPDSVTQSTVIYFSSIVTYKSGRSSAGLVGSTVTDAPGHDGAASDGVSTTTPPVYISGWWSVIFSRRSSSADATSINLGSDRQGSDRQRAGRAAQRRAGRDDKGGPQTVTLQRVGQRSILPSSRSSLSALRLTAVYVKVKSRLSQRDISCISSSFSFPDSRSPRLRGDSSTFE